MKGHPMMSSPYHLLLRQYTVLDGYCHLLHRLIYDVLPSTRCCRYGHVLLMSCSCSISLLRGMPMRFIVNLWGYRSRTVVVLITCTPWVCGFASTAKNIPLKNTIMYESMLTNKTHNVWLDNKS